MTGRARQNVGYERNGAARRAKNRGRQLRERRGVDGAASTAATLECSDQRTMYCKDLLVKVVGLRW